MGFPAGRATTGVGYGPKPETSHQIGRPGGTSCKPYRLGTIGTNSGLLLDLDLDVDAGGEVEALERIDGLGRGVHDVE